MASMADAKDGQVKLPHYPALDGLRGIAVLIVLVAHATPIYVSGAIGVDIFFVLSGFLITSILAGEILATGRIAVGRFYGRRFLRLLPALWVTIGGLTVLKIIGGTLDEQFGWEVLWAGGYVMNWVYALGLGTSEYLGHTWSLAMERTVLPCVAIRADRPHATSCRDGARRVPAGGRRNWRDGLPALTAAFPRSASIAASTRIVMACCWGRRWHWRPLVD